MDPKLDPKTDPKTPGPETNKCEHAPSRYLSARADRAGGLPLPEAEMAAEIEAEIEAAEEEALSWSRLANRC